MFELSRNRGSVLTVELTSAAMLTNFANVRKQLTFVLMAIVLSFSMWYYVVHILIPYQAADGLAEGRPTGNRSDLYPRWLGSRELILHGRDPYSAEVTREIQTGYYGRPLDANRPGDPRDQSAFAYPVFVAFLFAPFVHLSFAWVQLTFGMAMVLLTAFSVRLWALALGSRISAGTMSVITILFLGSYGVVQGLLLQQLTLLVAAFIAAAAALVAREKFVPAGCLLSLACIKPQLAAPAICFFALWSLADFVRRRSLLISFTGVLALLLAAAEWVMPGWFWRWKVALRAYLDYTGAHSLLQELLGRWFGLVVAVVLIFIAGALSWRARRRAAGSESYSLALASVISVTLLIIPKWAPYDQILLIPAVLCLVTSWTRLREAEPVRKIVYLFATLVVFWPWVAALFAMIASLAFGTSTAARLVVLPLGTVMLIPIALGSSLALLVSGTIFGTSKQPRPAAGEKPAIACKG